MTKIALITGAGSGIGRTAAQALSEAGFSIVLTGRDAAKLDATAALLKGDSLCFAADISEPGAVKALFAAIKARFGRLDLLFNNAGVFSPSVAIEDIAFADWQAAVGVNLTGAFLCAQEAVRLMKAQKPQGGRIINNGSISAQTPRPNAVAYTATKHAITGLTKSIALDGRAFNIACGQIDIGNAASPMTAAMKKGVPQANGAIMPEPTMDVAEIGRALVYMAGLPLDANVLQLTVMATTMPFVGRG
jgi:NAD(P)-dependent dehydrogenase (short-subunit alcohol dehydrogenase family)